MPPLLNFLFFMADWLSITTGIGGLLGNLGSSIGGLFQAGANRRFQAKQAELQRQFNSNEAQKARNYNTQMVNAQNFYNSPQEQVKRLVAAGLHPSLAYGGNGAIQNIGVGSTSAQASSGASPSGAMGDLSSLSHLGTDLASTLQSLTQADVNSSIRGLNEKQLFYYDQFAKSNLADINAGLALKFSLKGKTDAEIKEVCALTEQAEAAAKLLGEQALNENKKGEILEYDAVVKKFEARFAEESYQDKIEKFAAEAHITKTQAIFSYSVFAADLAYTQALTSLTAEQRKLVEYDWKQKGQEIRAGLPWKQARYYDAQSDHLQWDMDTWVERQIASGALGILSNPEKFFGKEETTESFDSKGNFKTTRRSQRLRYPSMRR